MAAPEVYDDVHLLSVFEIKLNGSNMPQEMVNDVLEIVVEQSLHIPSACTIRLHDWDRERNQFQWVDDSRIKAGTAVEVKFGYGNTLVSIFKGEITAIEMDAAAHMVPNLVVHCVSKEHRLHRNRVRKTYQNVTDSDIVSQVASRCGLSPEVESTGNVRDWVCQNNQTDYDFLKMLADRSGCRMWVEGSKLLFKKVKAPADPEIELAWGDDLRSFRPRMSTHGMVDEVSVRSWDMKTKKEVVSTVQSSSGMKSAQIGFGQGGGEAAKSAFGGEAKHAIVDWPANSVNEAKSIAQSYIDKRESTFVESDGLCIGNPKIAPDKTVQVKGVGQKFSGKYHITSATHTFTPAEGYTTQFVVSGKNPHTLLGMIHGEMSEQENPGGYIVIAIVTDNNDPQKMGRIKVKYPWMMDEVSDWARMASPMAGGGRGIYFLPEINDEVLIAFEHGDIHRPFMIGALWNGTDAPVEGNDKAVSGGKVIHRVTQTRKGHIFMLDDEDQKEKIKFTSQGMHELTIDDTSGNVQVQIKTKDGHTFVLDDTNKKIEVKSKDGHKLTLDDGGKKIVLVDSSGSQKMTIDSVAGDIKWECNGKFSVDAKAGIELTTLAQAKLDSKAGTTVSSSAVVTIQGSLVKIN